MSGISSPLDSIRAFGFLKDQLEKTRIHCAHSGGNQSPISLSNL